MIDGRHWSESEFLKQAVEDCKDWAKEDSYFFKQPFKQSFSCCMKRKIREWTWIKEEQESILNEIMEDE